MEFLLQQRAIEGEFLLLSLYHRNRWLTCEQVPGGVASPPNGVAIF